MLNILFRNSITVKTTSPSLCFVFVYIIHIWPHTAGVAKNAKVCFVYLCIYVSYSSLCISPPQVCTLGEASVYVYIIFHSKVALSIGSPSHISESKPQICFINGKYTHNLTFSDTSWPSVLFCPCPRVLCHHGSGNFDCFVLVFKLLSSGNVSDMPGDYQIWKHDNATFEQQTVIYKYPNVNPWYLRSTLHWK